MAYKYLNDNGLKAYTKKVKGALKDLHTPIAISTENTTESKAQNVKNIADFVAKAKAAGIADVNGMAVTCLLSSGYSGVGYLHFVDGNYTLQGVEIQEELERSTWFLVWDDGSYKKTDLITGEVTSQMLARGARRPIILTPETTEVDEETYEKLLSDDVDVVFKTSDGILCILTYEINSVSIRSFFFSALSAEGTSLADTYLHGYEVAIDDTVPHKVTVQEYSAGDMHTIIDNNGFINKSVLSPVLQEIDLTGTDVERKAKLDKFETDWKDLTGASDLIGARFVGKVETPTGNSTMIFTWNDTLPSYIGKSFDDTIRDYKCMVRSDGTIHIYPIFSHLEPITIKTGSAAADIAANKAAIKAYIDNLSTELGLSTSKGYQVSVVVTSDGEEYTGTLNIGTGTLLMGIVSDLHETHHYPFHVEVATGIVTFDKTNYFLEKTSNEVTEMLDAIKYSYTPVPLTATTLSNKAQLEVFLSKVPNAQVMHVTYKDVYAGTLHKINGDWFGLLVKNTNNYEDALQVKLQADGTLIEGTTSLAQVNAKLDTIIG
nr:MAG TPA: hypothetical protein [Caudoviricetes sp.]